MIGHVCKVDNRGCSIPLLLFLMNNTTQKRAVLKKEQYSPYYSDLSKNGASVTSTSPDYRQTESSWPDKFDPIIKSLTAFDHQRPIMLHFKCTTSVQVPNTGTPAGRECSVHLSTGI